LQSLLLLFVASAGDLAVAVISFVVIAFVGVDIVVVENNKEECF
jgi:hypothetical protein